MSNEVSEAAIKAAAVKESASRAKQMLKAWRKAKRIEDDARNKVYESCTEVVESLIASGMTGKDIATRTGHTRSYISLIRKGSKQGGVVTLENLIRVATVRK